MEMLLSVNWTGVIVSAIVAFIAGSIWYSNAVFGKKWREGVRLPMVNNISMVLGMLAQAFGTFFFAWLVGAAMEEGESSWILLAAVATASLVKANGYFAQKSKFAIMVEATYVLVMIVLMILVYGFIA